MNQNDSESHRVSWAVILHDNPKCSLPSLNYGTFRHTTSLSALVKRVRSNLVKSSIDIGCVDIGLFSAFAGLVCSSGDHCSNIPCFQQSLVFFLPKHEKYKMTILEQKHTSTIQTAKCFDPEHHWASMWSQGSYGTEEYMSILAVHVQSITINKRKSNLCFGNSQVKILDFAISLTYSVLLINSRHTFYLTLSLMLMEVWSAISHFQKTAYLTEIEFIIFKMLLSFFTCKVTLCQTSQLN